MNEAVRVAWLGVFALVALTPARAAASDCSNWTLDGYRLGMRSDELLPIRSVTLHVVGQAQAIEPGTLHGVLVLDNANHLEKWEVVYDVLEAEALRATLLERLGSPVSDVTGTLPGFEPDSVRQRRTLWRSAACDAAVIVYENTGLRGPPGHSVTATLVRASKLPNGLAELKTLFP